MSKNLETPIIWEYQNKQYLLMNVILTKDNSIYFTFPSNNKRYISKIRMKRFDNTNYVEHNLKLIDYDKENLEPKISFHPKGMIAHVNSNITKKISNDFPLLNISATKSKLITYFLQIIFPANPELYKEYTDTKHKDKLIIRYLPHNDILNIEIILHSKDIYPDPRYLPPFVIRNFKFYSNLRSPYKYSYSIFVSTLPNNSSKNIAITLNTKYQYCTYILDESK